MQETRAASGRGHHASVEPKPDSQEHLKIAFFFRQSAQGERRAKRSLLAEEGTLDVHEAALAQRRQRVMHEMSAFSLEAQSLKQAAQGRILPL